MKKFLPLFALAVCAMTPMASAGDMAKDTMAKSTMAEVAAPQTTAVAFHADWCGGCKILGPKMEKVMNTLDEETKAKFAMIKFDFTDEASIAKTTAMADEKSVTGLIPKGKPSTGVIKLIDNASGAVLAKIHYKMSEEEIIGTIKAVTSRS